MIRPTLQDVHSYIADAESAGQRIDAWLARQLTDVSRSRIQALIHDGLITLNGSRVKDSHKLKPGESIRVEIPAPVPVSIEAEAILIDVLYEDADILVLNKPSGLVVHPSAGHAAGTLVNALLHHCVDLAGIGGEQRPGIVHRLDKDTSGVMVVAKNEVALAGLGRQFKERTLRKEYLALVWGRLSPPEGVISTTIGRHPSDRKRMSVRSKVGRPAVTRYRIETVLGDLALVRVRIETGRTHQIRVHLAHLGHPVVGDMQYGKRSVKDLPIPVLRQLLHAETLAFQHPVTRKALEFRAPVPADMTAVISALGG